MCPPFSLPSLGSGGRPARADCQEWRARRPAPPIITKKGGPLMALPFYSAWNAPYMAGSARPTVFKGDPAGRPYLWGLGVWRRGPEVHRRDACATALGPLPHIIFNHLPLVFTPRRLWVERPARPPALHLWWGWGPASGSAPPFPWPGRRISGLPRRTG